MGRGQILNLSPNDSNDNLGPENLNKISYMSKKKRFYITTLGCKVNQYESDGIACELKDAGWTRETACNNAHVCIINTCTVTSRAAMQSRQETRSIIRANPDALIIVTGCHAQTDSETIGKIENIDWITGHREKFDIARAIIESRIPSPCFPESSVCTEESFKSFKPAVFGSNTRAYLKIQDGCNAFCTYCIVPYARGRSRSMPENEVMAHLETLSHQGFHEAILTGIHLGAYGLDFENSGSLLHLIQEIVRLRPIHRIRLSSMEPKELCNDIISLAAKSPSICDHFHIPLQSGDDGILKKMTRPYDTAYFRELVMKIHNACPSAAIGVDILEGFPGETEDAFENTYNLIESLPVSYLHVFPFSPRKGTPAYDYPNKVDTRVIKDRCAKMRKLGIRKKRAFEQKEMGQIREAVIQETKDQRTGLLKAVTSNYLTILVESHGMEENKQLRKKIVNVQLTHTDSRHRLFGKIL